MKPISLPAILIFALVVSLVGGEARAERRTFIRDAETENTIRDYASPLFQAAGLVPDAINIYIVRDPSLNAFVMGGQNLFIHTGLIIGTDNVSQIIGVIAHETGHIAGGHLARSREALENARTAALVGTVLGAAVAVGTGRGDAGALIMQGGANAGIRNLMSFSRTQEAAADNAALTFLDKAGESAEGLLQFMNKLRDEELLSANRQSPYMRTHPMSRDRYLTVEDHVKHSAATGKALPSRYEASYARMKAKLIAYVSPAQVARRYPSKDQSLAARYARAVAAYRQAHADSAVAQIDALLEEYPLDPYFHEQKGQVLFESGRVRDALSSYETAVRLLPTSSLIRRDLARAQIETGDDTLLDPAIANLNMTVQRDPNDTFAWHQLAIAQGRRGNMALSSLALAEEAVRHGEKEAALHHAGKVQLAFPRGSLEWLQAQDIIEAANLMGKK